jgi:hypothetical protein
MGIRADKPEKTEPEVAKIPGTETSPSSPASDDALPIVESPKLDGSTTPEPVEAASAPLAPEIADFIARSDAAAAPQASEPAAATPQPRSWRFALLAATIALAAGLGSFVGALTTSGLNQFASASAPGASTADAAGVAKALKSELAELNAMKSAVDGATHYANSQFTAISERLERVEQAQIDPAQLAHIADAVDRLGKLSAASPETTGSIALVAPPALAAAAPAEAKTTDRLLEDWVLEDVHGNRALVASRYGGEYLVTPGSTLPGVGRVDAVKRQDGQWVVLTARGMITEGH